MPISSIFALFLASAVNAAIPGPCIILTVARTARGGAAAGLCASAGILAADAVLAAAAVAVLQGMMALPEILFRLLQWAGAGVLLLLALQLLRAPLSSGASACGRAGRADFAGGLLAGISRPFNLVFFLALLPQFGLAEHGGLWSGLLLAATLLAGAAAAQAGAVLAGMGALRLPGEGGLLQRLAAALLAAFAVSGLAAPLV